MSNQDDQFKFQLRKKLLLFAGIIFITVIAMLLMQGC